MLKKYINIEIFELSIRIWAASYIFIYVISKPFQFQGAKSIEILINSASKPEMMWAFFGTTKEYPIIIGILEIIGAILFALPKSKLIGAFILIPILFNIVVLDYLYEIDKGALINAILYLLICLFVVVRHRNKVKSAIRDLMIIDNTTLENKIIKFLIAGLIAFVLFISYQIIFKIL